MGASYQLFEVFVVYEDASARVTACAVLEAPDVAVRELPDAS